MALANIKREHNLVSTHACRKTVITLRPYRRLPVWIILFNATESDGENDLLRIQVDRLQHL